MNNPMKQFKRAVGLTAILASSVALADPSIYQVQGFEYKAELHTNGSRAIQTLELPESIQRHLYDDQGQDIEVYNADGELIPSLVKFDRTEPVSAIQAQVSFYPLKTETITSEKIASSTGVEVNLQLNMNGETSVNTGIKSQEDQNQRSLLNNYILENPQYKKDSQLPGRLKKLTFTLEDGFEGIASLKLETGNDLSVWRTLLVKDTLVNMQFMDQKLHKNTLPISGKADKYIKLSWTGTNQPIISDINASFSKKSEKLDYKWSEDLSLAQVTDEKTQLTSFESRVSPAFKSNRFRLISELDNQIYTGNLTTKENKETKQKKQFKFRFYKVTTDEGEISRLERKMKTQSNPLWQFHFKYPQISDINNLPAIQVNRYPLNLYFLKQGDGPFYLAYGNNTGIVQDKSLSSIVKSLINQPNAEFDTATLGSIVSIEPLENPPEPLDWKQIFLWLVLGGGVLLMFSMARGLFKQINQNH